MVVLYCTSNLVSKILGAVQVATATGISGFYGSEYFLDRAGFKKEAEYMRQTSL